MKFFRKVLASSCEPVFFGNSSKVTPLIYYACGVTVPLDYRIAFIAADLGYMLSWSMHAMLSQFACGEICQAPSKLTLILPRMNFFREILVN